ncbi:MAG: GIY-YIG nuclease family protein [Leptolyngbyaceae bacterium]|nr:GIY-YIG nuclease family protein [Leptolyngbyaceae bacterium]
MLLSKDLRSITVKASLYAVRHRTQGLLYIGKTRYTRERFRDGHKALMWAWLDLYSPNDVALAIYPLDFVEVKTLSSQLEAIIIAATQPPYNVRYPARD